MTTVDAFIKQVAKEAKNNTAFQYFFYHHPVRGVRMFRVNDRTDTAIQIVLNAGEVKKGRGNNIGIYVVDRMTIFSNYGYGNYLKPTDKKSWDKAFKLVIKMIF